MHSEMPFISFDTLIKENRKAVRVHATKASAETRKATIARKRASFKKMMEAESVKPAARLLTESIKRIVSESRGAGTTTSLRVAMP
jgi:hypothetical protein